MQKNKKPTAEVQLETREAGSLTRALAAPFEVSEVRFKPGVISGNRALALAYVDARAIQDRLDAVLGVEGWQDDYECLPDGSVICRLRLRLDGEWVTKVDVGSPSEPAGGRDGGDRLKAAFSDALKRAAVKFGIGRYLYRLPGQWVDYDPKRRQLVKTPSLPAPAQPVRPESLAVKSKSERSPHARPANGAELQRRLYEYDARLAAQGVCKPGDLVKHVVKAGTKAGYGADLASWSGAAIALAVEETKTFEATARQPASADKNVA
jgi:hypothetical protein